jgi:hypothetical protein
MSPTQNHEAVCFLAPTRRVGVWSHRAAVGTLRGAELQHSHAERGNETNVRLQ